MAGHNKWSKIKRKKGVADARRSKVWARITRDIMVAAREGGGDVSMNARLALFVDKAKGENMPKDNIERAIKRGTGEIAGADYEEMSYEGYAPGGVALFVECLTDNTNRTVAEVRHAFSKNGGNLGTSGSVGYLFERKGVVDVPAEGIEEDDLFLLVAEAGAENLEREDDTYTVTAPVEDFSGVLTALKNEGIEAKDDRLERFPLTKVSADAETATKVLKLDRRPRRPARCPVRLLQPRRGRGDDGGALAYVFSTAAVLFGARSSACLTPPTPTPMIILGIDPGTRHTGYGVVEVTGRSVEVVRYGALKLNPSMDHALRLDVVYRGLLEVIDDTLPDECAIEMPIYGRNAQSLLKLARAQSAAMLAAMHREVPVTQYTPSEIKKAVTGNGNASKEQIWFMVSQQLSLTEHKGLDASDALGIALCHQHRMRGGPQVVRGHAGKKTTRAKPGSSKNWAQFVQNNPGRVV